MISIQKRMKMKKYIIGAFALLLFCACDPIKWLSGPLANWYIKNTTDKTLEIMVMHTDRRTLIKKNEALTLAPGDSILIYHSGRYFGDKELPPFDDFLGLDSIYVYDTDGEKLHTWLKKNMEIEERSVFKEEAWRHYVEPGAEDLFIWVYDIRNESLDHE